MYKKKIHVVIPMSGQGTRYKKAGYNMPKPMVPVNGVPMIVRLLEKFPTEWDVTFILADNHKDSGLVELLNSHRPRSQVLFVPVHNEGPAIPLKHSLPHLKDNDGILVCYCDFGMIWDPWQFQDFISNSHCDAALVSYKGFHAHYISEVKYAYSRLENGRVVEVKEKGSFTDDRENEYASCGAYYFKDKNTLNFALDWQIKNSISINGEFYTSLTVEALIRSKPDADVRIFEIPYFFQWGTPQDLQDFEYWEKSYQAKYRLNPKEASVEQILIPMAGLGSRFRGLTSTLKPFIKISDEMMYEKAISSLPESNSKNIVSLKTAENFINKKYKFHGLEETPNGQALTVEAGLKMLNKDQPILVSACDHGIAIDPFRWRQFQTSNADAAVFCIKGFPGTRRSPKSYSYVSVDDEDSQFPTIRSISLKQPFTESPSSEFLLVGSFWFKSASLLAKGINGLKSAHTFKNELYLDQIFNVLKENGHTCVVFPLEGYFNWGDPDSLREALYWEEVFGAQVLQKRSRYPGVELN